jgi:hypothetical protein
VAGTKARKSITPPGGARPAIQRQICFTWNKPGWVGPL